MSASGLSIVITADGSPTVWDEAAKAHFHSLDGARSESEHVYIQASNLPQRLQAGGRVRILEVGFGTGLNFMLAAELALASPNARLEYVAFDARLLPLSLLKEYYGHFAFEPGLQALVCGPEPGGTYRNVRLALYHRPWAQGVLLPTETFDVVFYDAFAPAAELVLWQEQTFVGAIQQLKPGGVLTTYSVTGNLKRLLRSHGLKSERPKGFGPKREMLVVYGNV